MSSKDFSSVRKNGDLPDPRSVGTDAIIGDLWQVYVDSSGSLLSSLEKAALNLEASKNIDENNAVIRRVLHSLKGDSGVTGIGDIYELCHQAEFAFEELAISDATDMILRVKDWIEAAIKSISSGDLICAVDSIAPVKEESKVIRALVIDDDNVCRKHVEMVISSFCDCQFAHNGQEGLDAFKAAIQEGRPFDLVTLDIQMPVMDGHETLEEIRNYEREQNIIGLDGVKVIMSTSQDDAKQIFSAFRAGCEAYVVKSTLGEKMLDEMAKLGLLKETKTYAAK
jgi:CheY-like chemotaxis protein/HPt (histidine-containing phosphotransfer) domain-containing protein